MIFHSDQSRPMTKQEKEEFMRDNQVKLRREGKLPAKERSPPTPKKSERKTGSFVEDPKLPEKPKIRAEPGPSFHSAVLKSMPPPDRRKEEAEKSAREREMKDLEARMKDLERKKDELEKRQKVSDYNERKRVEHQRSRSRDRKRSRSRDRKERKRDTRDRDRDTRERETKERDKDTHSRGNSQDSDGESSSSRVGSPLSLKNIPV